MIKQILFVALMACCLPSAVRGAEFTPAAMGVVDNGFADVTVLFDGSTLRVTNASGLSLDIYSVTGVRVMSVRVDGDDKSFKLNLQRGCYIVKVGNVVRKISVR